MALGAVGRDDRAKRSVLSTLLGRSLFGLGEYGQAKAFFQDSFDISSELADVKGQIINLVHLGNIEWATGKIKAAEAIYEDVVKLANLQGDSSAEADGRIGLGLVAQSSGFLSEASTAYQKAFQLSRSAGDRRRLGGPGAVMGGLTEVLDRARGWGGAQQGQEQQKHGRAP